MKFILLLSLIGCVSLYTINDMELPDIRLKGGTKKCFEDKELNDIANQLKIKREQTEQKKRIFGSTIKSMTMIKSKTVSSSDKCSGLFYLVIDDNSSLINKKVPIVKSKAGILVNVLYDYNQSKFSADTLTSQNQIDEFLKKSGEFNDGLKLRIREEFVKGVTYESRKKPNSYIEPVW